MKIISVVGARPNFMKIAPFVQAIKEYNSQSKDGMIEHLLVHTGQHYDDCMSRRFFQELNIPEPDVNLGIGSGSHAEQVGYTMIAFEKVIQAEKPDWIVVVGDVNATLACSVTAKKEWIRCCHIEAGLRSGDITMPEEINRLVTDRLCDLLLTPDLLSYQNLRNEGIPEEKIRFVGNIMIDTMEAHHEKASLLTIEDIIKTNLLSENKFKTVAPHDEKYVLMTLHRPSNVDQYEVLSPLISFLIKDLASKITLLWPIHPRTMKQLKEFNLFEAVANHPNIILLEPLGYIEMLRLNMGARVMLTDSGGLQEECTVLGTPCLTLRWNTERPVSLKRNGGVGVLVGNDINIIKKEFETALGQARIKSRPDLWDGKTAHRCLQTILTYKI